MPVYALYCPGLTEPPLGLERFPRSEQVAQALRLRTEKRESVTYLLGDGEGVEDHQRPRTRFPEADDTGMMVVWRRRPAEAPPSRTTPPEEVWTLSEAGHVRRSKWVEMEPDDPHRQRAYEMARAVLDETPVSDRARREEALKEARDNSPLSEARRRDLEETGVMPMLADLVQDGEVLDAVLRCIQPFMRDPGE